MGSRSPSLDVIRAICVILVLVTHFTGNFFVTGSSDFERVLRSVTSLGSFGVAGFFLLSSYLLTRILLVEHSVNATRIWSRYWARRLLRIWPLYFLVVLLFLVVLSFQGGLPSSLWLTTFTYNWVSWSMPTTPFLTHLWSVCAEEQLYLLVPILAALRFKSRVGWLLVFVTSAPVFRFCTALAFPYPAVWNFTTSQLDVFALGALIATLDIQGGQNWQRFRAIVGTSTIAGISFLLGLAALIIFVALWPAAIFGSSFSSLSYLAVALLFCVGFIICTERRVGRKTKSLQWVGQRSYGIYLFHWPLVVFGLEFSSSQEIPEPLIGMLSLLLTLGLSELSYRSFEIKLLNLKSRFSLFRAE